MIKVDTRQFDRALDIYQRATGKDFAQSANRGLKNACFLAVKHAKKANRSAIRAVVDNKLAAWVLAKRNRKESVQLKRVTKRGTWITAGSRVRYFTAAELREMKKKMVASRSRAISFMKGFLLRMAKAMEALAPGHSARGGAAKDVGLKLKIVAATPQRPTAGIAAAYNYRRRGGSIGVRAERILQEALNRGLNEAAADMTQYAQKKLAEQSARVSAA